MALACFYLNVCSTTMLLSLFLIMFAYSWVNGPSFLGSKFQKGGGGGGITASE